MIAMAKQEGSHVVVYDEKDHRLVIAEQFGCVEQFLHDDLDIQPNALVLEMLRQEL